ncbi:hypothetical protein M0Q50_09740 [bacterium]|nr:hypothetical protein [bacterium]
MGIQRTNDVLNLWETNPEDLEPEKYYSELDKIGPEITKNISNQIAKEQFMADFNKQIESAKFKIRSSYNKREVNVLQGTIELGNQNIIDNPPEDLHDPLHNTILLNHRKSYDKAIAVGLYTRDEAQYKWNDFLNKVNEGRLTSDIAKDSATDITKSYVYNQLKLGKEGIYGSLPEKSIGEGLDNIQKKVRRNQYLFTFQQNQNQDKNEAQMLVDSIDGNLNPDKVKNALLGQDIRRSFGEKMIKKVYDNPNPETDYSIYNKVRELQLTNATPQEINQFILDNSDKLNDADKKFLIDKTFSETDRKQKTIIRYNVDALKGWAKDKISLMPGASSDLIYEFHRRVNDSNAQGQAIDTIAQELQKEKIKELYPNTALMSDVPNFTASRNKLKRVYEKESKLKGKSQSMNKAINTVVNTGIGFDDL